jgi:fumarate reductase flavoprotein subunit
LKFTTARPISVAAVPDGTYTGVSRGMKGDVSAQVTVKGGRITDACVTTCSDLKPLTALQDIPERIKTAQGTQVDAVTGATVTSRAIMRAARNALEGLQPESWAKPPAN